VYAAQQVGMKAEMVEIIVGQSGCGLSCVPAGGVAKRGGLPEAAVLSGS
jgi:hypothetical protein